MSTVKAVVCTTVKKTMLDWEVFEPRPQPKPKAKAQPKAEHKARDELTLCEVEAFEAYWAKYGGDDSTPHDLNDVDGFFDGFNFEDERMHMKFQMFRVAEIKQAIKADVMNIKCSLIIGGLKLSARNEAIIIEQCNEYIASLPEVLATMEDEFSDTSDTSDTTCVSWGSTDIVEYTPLCLARAPNIQRSKM